VPEVLYPWALNDAFGALTALYVTASASDGQMDRGVQVGAAYEGPVEGIASASDDQEYRGVIGC
jgi:hypothetical protein